MKERKDLPQESLVRIFVNGDFLSSMLCTPRDLAARIAEDAGLTLVARVSSASPVVICGEERIVHESKGF